MKQNQLILGGAVLAVLLIGGFWWFTSSQTQGPLVSPQPAPAPQPVAPKTPKRLAMLVASDTQLPAFEGIKEGLKELGYKEGVDVVYDFQNPKGDRSLTAELAKNMVASRPDLLVGISTTATTNIIKANQEQKLPLVFVDVGNAKELDIENLSRPGGFMSGVVSDSVAVSPKRMEFLKEAVPNAKVFGVLINPKHVSYDENKKLHDEAAAILGIQLKYYNFTTKDELQAALDELAKDPLDGVLPTTEALISRNISLVTSALRKAKLPSINFNLDKGQGVDAGYMMVYATSRFDGGKQGARMIDKVLRGTPPGELPVEFVTAVHFEINMAVAREIGITIPDSLKIRATKLYEEVPPLQ